VTLGCIDIGSNTTRLLVAEAAGGSLRERAAERAFTRIGASMGQGGAIPPEKVTETAEVVRGQARRAREAGATEIVAVATAAIREAPNRDELVAAIEEGLGLPLRVLTGEEEARLSFVGATRTLPVQAAGTIAVVDVGGGSTEIAVGDCAGAMEWCHSLPVGSGLLADAHLRSDPPSSAELDGLRAAVAEAFDGLRPPAADSAVAVGGTATSLRRLAGTELGQDAFERSITVLSSTPIADIAARFDLDPERVRLLPAGILLLRAVSGCLELPLRMAHGCLREGVILEMAGG
jgi:exopolyphosphatase/guanosine-5'-triphosphate,3'-diphosphate pyrophosphatase